LRNRRLAGLKFRRQVPIGPFVVDFLCESANLVVEIDGQSHLGTGEADAARTCRLQESGLRVIRFTNDEVLKFRDAVLEAILEAALTPALSRGEREEEAGG
jgi:adenine-specific DNA-methyltransferase